MPYGTARRNHEARHGVFLRLTCDCGVSDETARTVSNKLPGYVAKNFCTEFDAARGKRTHPDFQELDIVSFVRADGTFGSGTVVNCLDGYTALIEQGNGHPPIRIRNTQVREIL
jgi:hypothetical protein